MPEEMQHLFLVSGGALAVENGLKAAFDWKVRKNFAEIGASNGSPLNIEGMGSKVIHFREAFHGRSGYTLSLTNTDDPRKYMYFPKFDWPRVVNPKLSFPLTDEIIAEVKKVEEVALSQIETAVKQYPGDIAALIIEPIQAEGGDNHFRPEFMVELRRLADEHEFLFIVDEVQSGMGLTGEMWAIQHTEVLPDVIAFGKKSQVCGIIAGARIEEVKGHVFEESSRINSTFGGNLTDMVRSTRYLEIIEEDNLLENTTRMGEHILDGLESVSEESKGMVSNVRGKGLMVAFDLPNPEARQKMMENMKENGLYALMSGDKSVRFRGMLDTPKEVIDEAVKIVAISIPVD
jgi:L-lysine 6-transaminase